MLKKPKSFKHSFASHQKSIYWDNEKNNGIKPENVCLNSNKKFWFKCNCGHCFEGIIYNITNNNSWCPYCAIPSRVLCKVYNCVECFNKSFASHPKVIYWNKKNEIEPRDIMKGSEKYFLFDCYECKHVFKISLHQIKTKNLGVIIVLIIFYVKMNVIHVSINHLQVIQRIYFGVKKIN